MEGLKNMKKLLIVILFLVLASSVSALSSAILFPSSVEINEALKRNQEVRLPDFRVTNVNPDKMKVKVEVIEIEGVEEMVMLASWLDFNPKEFELENNETQVVKVSLAIPKDAKFGKYVGYLKVGQSVDSKDGMRIIPNVAAVVKFEVQGTLAGMEWVFYMLGMFFNPKIAWAGDVVGGSQNLKMILIVIGCVIVIELLRLGWRRGMGKKT